jgi:hypothetical protein
MIGRAIAAARAGVGLRLGFESTAFGDISPTEVINEILEGDGIAAITFEKTEHKAYAEGAASR